jgi:hypothetical protein
MKDKHYRSDIPAEAVAVTVRPYARKGGAIWLRCVECRMQTEIVGKRFYDEHDRLVIEEPLRQGKKHGRVYTFYDNGRVQSAMPYVDGLEHGTARQWDEAGKLMGTYRLVHGTGFDLWRQFREDGSLYLSEIHTMREGLPHGFEWWLNEDEASVHHERHWHAGEWHGIERYWNWEGRLRRGYPKYWIRNRPVTRRQYLSAARRDDTLLPFRAEENRPQRRFPEEIEMR